MKKISATHSKGFLKLRSRIRPHRIGTLINKMTRVADLEQLAKRKKLATQYNPVADLTQHVSMDQLRHMAEKSYKIRQMKKLIGAIEKTKAERNPVP